MVFNEGRGLSDAKQEYDPTSIINELRQRVDQWRALPNPAQWLVPPSALAASPVQQCSSFLLSGRGGGNGDMAA
jgi:hypothetical protein